MNTNTKLAKFMIIMKEWQLDKMPLLKIGDLITIETAFIDRNLVGLHLGGMLRAAASIDELLAHARIAEPDEFIKTLKRCPRCSCIEIEKNKWLRAPECFSPRDGVKLVDETCPSCEETLAH